MRTAALLLLAGGCGVTALDVKTRATVADAAPAPAFSLPDAHGHAVSLASELARGDVVLVFYRGHW